VEEKKEKEKRTWSARCGTDDGLVGDIGYPSFVGGNKGSWGKGGVLAGRKEGRKEGTPNELFGATENRINETKTEKFRGGVRLRTFEDNYRRTDSILRSVRTAERGGKEARSCRSKPLFKVAARSRRCRTRDKSAVKLVICANERACARK